MQQFVRISAKVAAGFLSALILLLPVTANALGLGNIKMESALNEPLRAQIELLSATSDDVKELQVNLASREAFLRAGVDRSAMLSQIKFKITKRNSRYYVTLTTQQSVREPFLNFLVELNWKNGRMLREYTVLLDPAGGSQQSQMAQAPETTPPESKPAPAPAPVTASQEPVPAPTSPFMGQQEAAAPAEAPTTEAAPEPQPITPETQTAEAPAPAPVAEATPEPAPAPAPEAAPEPAPAPAPTETAATAPQQPFEPSQTQQDDGGLFPEIPLRAYHETGSEQAESAPAPEPAPMPAGESQAEATAPSPMPAGELDYGITKKGDNLWRIAEKLKPSDQVTIYQVMMALQQSNPKAFVHGNIHRLKVGQVMRIEDPSLLTTISKRQAVRDYETQTRDWENYLANVGKNVPRQTIVAGEQPQTASGSGVPSGELTLASPQSEKNGAGASSSDVASSEDAALLEKQARKAMREAKKARKHNKEVTAKLNDLEAELNKMQNLVTVKNSDLAELQRKLDELNKQRAKGGTAAESPTPAETAPEAAPVPTTPEAAQTEAATPEPTPEAVTPEPSAPEAGTPEAPQAPPTVAAGPSAAPAPSTEVAETPTAAPATAQPTQAAQPSVPSAPPVAAPPAAPAQSKTTSAPKSGGGIMGTIKGIFSGILGGMSAMLLIVIGVVAVVVVLLIFIIMRRRKGSSFQESILTGAGGDEDSVSLDGTSQGASSLMGGESSFLSDFAISGVSAIQAEDSEVDPLTEADVFMAYGRHEAAEERLQEAITQDPNRGELRVKLLELYNTTKDKQAFETAAEDYYAALGGNADSNPLWQKVVAMGRELAPGNPLFSGGVSGGSTASPTLVKPKPPAEDNHANVMDIGLDTGVFNTSDFSTDAFNEPAAAPQEPSHMDSGLDFNLDIGQPAEEPAAPAADDMDFSLDFGGVDETGGGMDLGSSDQGEDLAAGLDFALDGGTDSSSSTHDDMDLSFNLEGDEEPTATEIKLDDGGGNGAGLDFDFSTDSAGSDFGAESSDASMGDLDGLGGGDEVGTKLDLARAYIDMGDPDGARSILDEVMEEGNAGQKQEAQQLMTQIG